ncbi:alpha-E domain-containing protein [Ochrovirga pacifica]|uniref:alpha-E domain-containing protein n=1 Tax=Ochrovirga pacifica TaxID=1042376 RepID=UPI0002559D8D|nr:alpha-E domain-containing protein [Ochrovirga pacifica]
MLARVANNLFWMGRYLERTEHIARFMNVNYFSSLDAPSEVSQSRNFVLKSILFLVSGEIAEDKNVTDEKKVLYDVGLNPDNDFSILNCFKCARENASGSRDLLSTELFESINSLHHYITNYPSEHFVANGLDEFTSAVSRGIILLRGKIIETLIHDEAFAIISLGMNLERASQVIRIINTKYVDAKSSKTEFHNSFTNSFEWTTLLKSIQSFDMMKRYYKKAPTSADTLDFLILNPSCPRSVMSSLNSAAKYIKILTKNEKRDSSSFLINKIRCEYSYTSIDEIEGRFADFIEEIIDKITEISIRIEEEFFSY